MATPITTPPAAIVHRVVVLSCLASLVYVLLSQHLLPSGDERGARAGPLADFVEALHEVRNVWSEQPPAKGSVAHPALQANHLLKQHMDDLERRLEERSHLRDLLLPSIQWLLAAAGGVGNERVYLGKSGWLTLRQGFDYLTGPPFLDPGVLERRRRAAPAWRPVPRPDPRPAIFDFQRQLEQRGIRLLILPAPTKVMIHPEVLGAPADDAETPALHNASFAEFRAELERRGVAVFDPAAMLRRQRHATGSDQFLRTDSHWSPAGLDAVGRGLADRIRLLRLPFQRRPVAWRRQRQSIEGVGDLERTLLLPAWQKLYAPQRVEVSRVVSRAGQPWRPDPRAEILLLGDSFTNVYSQPDVGWGRSSGLAEQLSYYLDRPVDRIAVNAGGVTVTRRRLALEQAAGKDRLTGKQLVIWEFAVRELVAGDWELVDLPLQPSRG